MSIQVNDFQWEPGKNDAEYIKLLKSSMDDWQKIAQKAVAKLKRLSKAQEPRVLTLEEVRSLCKDDIVWYDHKGVYRQPRPRVVEFVFDNHITFTDGGNWSFSADGYGECWRLWTSRPTDEQREATAWSLTEKCPWCGGELFRVYGAMNYPWDYSCSKCHGYCFERDVLRANEQRAAEKWNRRADDEH